MLNRYAFCLIWYKNQQYTMKNFLHFLYILTMIMPIGCVRSAKKGDLPPLRVDCCKAKTEAISSNISIPSKIESLYEATIQPRVNGYILRICYDDGMPIKKGATLFEIDPSQLNTALLSAKAELESAKAQEILAKHNFERAVPLARIDAISQSDLDQYTASYSAAQASVISAEEALQSNRLDLGYATITAPIDGVVASTEATVGDYVGPETELQALTTVSYNDTIVVDIAIPTNRYLDNRADFNNSFDNSDLLSNIELHLSNGELYDYQGAYYYTKKQTPENSSTVVVVARFPNTQQRLKSGMFTRVSANIGAPKECVVVPQKAINQNQGVNSLWIVKPDSTVEFRKVEPGDTSNEDWVVDSGVEAGEMVLLTGQLKVHDGAKVVPTLKEE